MSGRPKAGYRLADGTRVPGVTTIIGRFKESGGLIHWAWNLGMQGTDYRDVRDAAAGAGSLAHSLVEQRIRDRCDEPDFSVIEGWQEADEETQQRAVGAFGAFRSWESMSRLEVVEQEVSLVSESLRFGGTLDAVIQLGGELALGDWKSANSLYRDNLIQLAAYKYLWEEAHPAMPLTGGFHLCRFDKEHGDFAHHFFAKLDDAWRAFVLMRELYEIDKALKKRAA